MRRGVFLVVAAVAGLLFTGAAFAAEKVNFTPGWLFYGRDVGFFASIERGHYSREGIDLNIVPGRGATDAVSTVASGANRFALAGVGAVVMAAAQRIPVKLVSMYHDKALDGVYVLKGSGIQTPKDLEGKNIGTTAKDAPTMLFPAFAKANGIDLGKVKWTYMAPPAKIPSLLAGKVDATITFHNSFPSIVAGARKIGKEAVALLYADWGVDIYSAGLIAKSNDIAKSGDLVRRFLKATYEGTAWAIENPEAAARLFMKRNPTLNAQIVAGEWKITAEHLLTHFSRKHGLGYIDREKMARTVEIVARSMDLKTIPETGAAYSIEHLPKVFTRGAKN